MNSSFEQWEARKLKPFNMFWGTRQEHEKNIIKQAAREWHGLSSMFIDCGFVIDALRLAGAYVHVHGFDPVRGIFAFEVTNWNSLIGGVFEIMQVNDPRHILG